MHRNIIVLEGVTLDLIELYKHDYIEEFTVTTNKSYSYIDPETEEVIVEETTEIVKALLQILLILYLQELL